MPTGKVPAKRAPKLSPRQRKKLAGPWHADGPMDYELARKLASALLGKAEPPNDSEPSGNSVAKESDSEET